ncbi:MAG: methyltransferase domain-containing protein [Deltaproteobacteria bacterium]|nr:methyltransferase domain-containing protein [Deltaproteobacteria bacterium]
MAALGRTLDRAIRRVVDLAVAFDVTNPLQRALDARRREVVESLLAGEQGNVADVAARLGRAEPDAHDRLSALAERSLAVLRHDLRDAVSGPLRLYAAIDGRLPTRESELLDDPALPAGMRRQILEDLDHMNRTLGSYPRFLDLLAPWLATDRPTRILDLAAGHGGFDLELAREARARGIALEITATDLKREYLDIGRVVAEREGLDVRFEVQDALDLSNLRAPGAPRYDVITCTQSLHHFPVGLVSVMIHEAAATSAVLFIDGYRSLTTLLAVPSIALRFGHYGMFHDAFVSSRRFFVPEELRLLACVTPAAERTRAFRIPPGFTVLRIDPPTGAPAPADRAAGSPRRLPVL